MVHKYNDADIFQEGNRLTAGLEGALQNHEVSDKDIIQALVHDFFPTIYQVALFGFGEAFHAREAAEKAILEVVASRDKFWGDTSVKAWIVRITLNVIQKIQAGKRTSHPPKWLASRDLVSLDLFQAQLVLLRFGLQLNASEIAYIQKQKPEDAAEQISGILRQLLQTNGSSDSPHPAISRLILEKASGLNLESEELSLRDHLELCSDCRDYSVRVDHLARGLSIAAQSIWPVDHLSEAERAQIFEETENLHKLRATRRLFSLKSKEVFLVGLVITAVLILSWAFRLMSGEDDFSGGSGVEVVKSNEAGEVLAEADGVESGSTTLPETGVTLRNELGGYQGIDTGISLSKLPLEIFHEPDNWVRLSGPNALEMVLSYWGDANDPETALQTRDCDETALSDELSNYVRQHTDLKAIRRFGGDPELLQALTVAGFPVIIQTGNYTGEYEGWVGHYDVVAGFQGSGEWTLLASREHSGLFIPLLSTFLEKRWMAFNYVYILVYPTDREAQVQEILGRQYYLDANLRIAEERIMTDISRAGSDLDRFFAWYNQGSNLASGGDYFSAALAFDRAFAFYNELPDALKPWRILWYQNLTYSTFFHTGRYQDVVDLATLALEASPDSFLSESYSWRAMALEKLGDQDGAIEDLSKSLQIKPGYLPEKLWLERLFSRPN